MKRFEKQERKKIEGVSVKIFLSDVLKNAVVKHYCGLYRPHTRRRRIVPARVYFKQRAWLHVCCVRRAWAACAYARVRVRVPPPYRIINSINNSLKTF